ncbi:MAG TPA: lipase family protein [Pyrinomonadaceae bacterium]|nr:lipase family protein [Pyrinomonadaceae bacterium]
MSWTYPSGFDATTALTYANFCQQAYFQYYIYSKMPPDFGFPPYSTVIQIPPPGYTLLYDIYYNEGVLFTDWVYFGYVAQNTTNTSELVFAIRGTMTAEEWYEDLLVANTGPSSINGVQGNVHQGFNSVYKSLVYCPTGQTPNGSNQVTLANILSPPSPGVAATTAVVTGHSLGAAVAILMTADLAYNYSSTSSTPTSLTSLTCYSFAAPMVGDPTFAAAFNSLIGANSGAQITAHYRLANGFDPVPNLPPNVFYNPSMEGLTTAGTFYYMQVNDYCPVDSGVMSIVADPHSLTSYATGLNYLITPPTSADLERAGGRESRFAASMRSAASRRAKATTPSSGG